MPMATETKRWTLEELHSLPDDGNKYELIRGVLFVTPAPRPSHETICARLSMLLTPYVIAQRLGLVYRPRAVVRYDGSEVEPDLMVTHLDPDEEDWAKFPPPLLVVEVLSRTTRRRDRNEKRELYLDAGVAEYWIVDGEERAITIVRPLRADETRRDAMSWRPAGASEALTFDLVEVFGSRD